MSHTLDSVNVTGGYIGPGRGDNLYPPQLAPTQEPRGVSNFVDGSGPIFSMYLEMATEEDKKMVEGWKADADGILIFTGLFSAAVASLISVTIQDVRPNPQDTSNFYLANIYQTLADPNRSTISSSLPTSPPPFSPPKYAVWVNTLLFLSLVISISCALLATLLQQWSRSYLKVTQPRYSQHKRARIRAFFFEGVDKFLLPWAVEALPSLLHVSVFSFFAGVSVFLWNVDLTIFKSVVSWVGICTALYGCITFVPIFRHDSPYHTPLSLPAWHLVAGISFVVFWLLRWLTLFTPLCFPCFCFGPFSLDRLTGKVYDRFGSLKESYRKLLLQGMRKTVEKTALSSPSEIDTRAFLWTFDSLDEDHELERFFSSLPGFRSSKFVADPLPGLTEEQKEKLLVGLMGLLNVTFSSDLLPAHVKDRRAIICAKASDPAHIPGVFCVFDKILSRCKYSGPMTTEIVQIMNGWGNNWGDNTGLVATICKTIARVQQRDDSWFTLASGELGAQEPVLREYAAHGDSLSLAILNHVVRQQFNRLRERHWPWYEFSVILEAASKFNVEDTSHDLQHEFCTLWNQIVLKAQNHSDPAITEYILRPIRDIYVFLHQDTDSAPTRFSASTDKWDPILFQTSSYPVCNVVGHVHDDSSPVTLTRTAPGDNAAPVPASLASPDAPSSSVPSPLRVVESPMDVPLLDNFHPAHQTTTESLRIPATSPDPATADAFVAPGIIIPHPTTSATSTSAFPLSSTSSSTAVALQHKSDILTHSDSSDLPYSASSNPVLDNPTESHRSLNVTTAPRNSPRPTSAPNLSVAAEDDGDPKPGAHKENDALGVPSVSPTIHANTMALDHLLQSSSLQLVTHSDVAIVGPSLREPNTERTGDHIPHSSHCPYDIV